LAAAGYEFDIHASGISETTDDWLNVRENTLRNAVVKALATARVRPSDVVLAADTLVDLDGEPIGKPRDRDGATAILRRLSGRTHVVTSTVVICQHGRKRFRCISENSRVRFKQLSDAAIREYLSKINPLDKAGAYAAQGHGKSIIAELNGSYTNVVGLPMEQTNVLLAQFGISPRKRQRIAAASRSAISER
jgi:septum formation protein